MKRKMLASLLLALLLAANILSAGLAQPLPKEAAGALQLTAADLTACLQGEQQPVFTGEAVAFQASDLAEAGGTKTAPAARNSAAWTPDYYGAQLDVPGAAVYEALRASSLWDGPSTEAVDLTEHASLFDLSGRVTARAEGTSYAVSCDLDTSPITGLVFGATAALLYDHPELSWLVNTLPGISYRCSPELTQADYAAIQRLAPGESLDLGVRPVRLERLTYQLDAEGYRRATTSPEQVGGADRFAYADTGSRSHVEAALGQAQQEIGSLAGLSAGEKVEVLHDWLCAHTEYADRNGEKFRHDWRGFQTAYSALVEKETVCAGYAKAFKLLCDDYGIPCVIASGVSRGEAHAWNYVQIAGSWYGVDVTWADQSWGISRDDFRKGSAAFFQDHTEQPLAAEHNFTYPELADSDYDPLADPIPPEQPRLILQAEPAGLLVAPGDRIQVTAAYKDPQQEAPSGTWTCRPRPQHQSAVGGSFIASVPQSASAGTAYTVSFTDSHGVSASVTFTTVPSSSIQVSSTRHGTFSVDPIAAAEGRPVRILLTPEEGYQVDSVAVVCADGSHVPTLSVDRNTCEFIMPDQSVTVSAAFAPRPAELALAMKDAAGKTLPYGSVLAPGDRITAEISGKDLAPGVTASGVLLLTGFEGTGGSGPQTAFTVTRNQTASIPLQVAVDASDLQVELAALDPAEAAHSFAPWAGRTAAVLPPVLMLQVQDAFGRTLPSGAEVQSGQALTALITVQDGSPEQVEGTVTCTGFSDSPVLIPFELPAAVPLRLPLPKAAAGGRTLTVDVGSLLPAGTACSPASWSGRTAASPQVAAEVRPAPGVESAPGHMAGRVNGRVYQARTVGANMMVYLPNSAGRLARVSVPYITGSSGERFYPVNCGSRVLYPRAVNGKLSAYCTFQDGKEIPVFAAAGEIPVITGNQTGTVNGRTYTARTVGANMMFYLPNSAGRLARVSVPYVTDSSGERCYPINCAGTVLFPVLENGRLAGYTSGEATVLTAVA